MRVIAALLTCHNRKAKTLACLRHLFDQPLPPQTSLKVYLVDDGSTDGTSEEIRATFPSVHVIAGDGSLFWAEGLRLAWRYASKTDPDAYFWLNDDTFLYPGALAKLIETADLVPGQPCIAVGSCQDPVTGRRTYGGERLQTGHPGKLAAVDSAPAEAKRCDTFNGNCVLITKKAFQLLGPIRAFKHSMGDTDYGLRATQLGIPVILTPGYLASCQNNPVAGSWMDLALPRTKRFRLLMGRKGLPPSDWWRFLWQHAGIRTLLYWPRPYLRVLAGR
jgi:GT2 family glycosyltransferase